MAKEGHLRGRSPDGERRVQDDTYQVRGEALVIDGLGSVVKSRTTNLPPGNDIIAHGCSVLACDWYTRAEEIRTARRLFSLHQEIHIGTPVMVALVKTKPEVFAKLLEAAS